MTTNVQKNNVSVNKFRHIIITTSLGTLKVKSENISPFLDSCSAWRTRRINTKNQSATSQKRGRLKCTPSSAAAATFGPVGTSGTFGTLGTDGTSPSLSMSFLTLAAVPWDNPVSFSILDNDVYTFGKCRFIKPCHSKMKDKT